MVTKACKNCKSLVEGSTCPMCGSHDLSDSAKGRIDVLSPEQSELAKQLTITKKGSFALRLR